MTTTTIGKLRTLAEIEGYPDGFALLEEAGFDSVVPGICCNVHCDYTTGVEPDSTDGWCEACDTGTVKSCLILAGVI